MLATSPPKSCLSSLLWTPKEALEGNPPLAFADCAGLPADAGGCDGGGGEGVVLLSPAHSTTATDEHVLRQKLECGGTEIPSFTISFLCDRQEVT